MSKEITGIHQSRELVVGKQGSGTYINSELYSNCKNIGVLLTHVDCHTFPNMVMGIDEVLSPKNHRIVLSQTQNKVDVERSRLLSLLSANVDGLITEAVKTVSTSPNLEIYEKFAARNIPVIFVNVYYSELDCNYIVNNDVQGGCIATQYLIDQGHSKIGGIFKHDSIQAFFRHEGFVNKLKEQGLKLDESRVVWYSYENLDNLFSDENLPLFKRALSKCSAVVCYNDRVASKLVIEASTIGINIPDDLSVVSFDNSQLCWLTTPSITSVTHPGEEMGKLAAESILQIIDNPSHKIQYTFQPELVVRDSVRFMSS